MPHELFYFSFLRFQTGANRLKIKFCTKKLNSFFLKNWVWYLEKQSTGLTDLGSPMARFLLRWFIFRDFGHLQRVNWAQSPISRFGQNSDFSKILQKLIFHPLVLPLVKISARSNHIWGSYGPKQPQNGSFHGSSITTKIFEVLQLGNQKCYKDGTYHDCTSP